MPSVLLAVSPAARNLNDEADGVMHVPLLYSQQSGLEGKYTVLDFAAVVVTAVCHCWRHYQCMRCSLLAL